MLLAAGRIVKHAREAPRNRVFKKVISHDQTKREFGVICLLSRDLRPMSRVPIKTHAGDPATLEDEESNDVSDPAALGEHLAADVGDPSGSGDQQSRDATDRTALGERQRTDGAFPAASDQQESWNEAYPDDDESGGEADLSAPDKQQCKDGAYPAASSEQQTTNVSDTCDCDTWYDARSQSNTRFFRQIHGTIHLVDEWRRRIRGYTASLGPLLKTTAHVMAMERADSPQDPRPTPYHFGVNGRKTAARHICTIEDEYFVCVYHFHALRDDYVVFGRDLRRVLNDPGFVPQYQRDKLAGILRAGMEKLTVDLHNRFVQARDSLRQAHLGVLGLYSYTRAITEKEMPLGVRRRIDTDMWAKQSASVFMAELHNLRHAMMEEYDFRYRIGRHGDWRLQFWMDQWTAMPEEERTQLYGYRGSGWYRTSITSGFNPDRRRQSEPDWNQLAPAASWGERVFDMVYGRMRNYLMAENRLRRRKFINVRAMYQARYQVLVPRLAQRVRDDRLTPLFHQLLHEFSTYTDPLLAKNVPTKHSKAVVVSPGGTRRQGPPARIPQPRANQAPRQVAVQPALERDDRFYEQMGPLFDPVHEDPCIDDFPDKGSVVDNPRVALEFLDSLWEDDWRWQAVTNANRDGATEDFARWGRRASTPLEPVDRGDFPATCG